jgi:hypothetical protein
MPVTKTNLSLLLAARVAADLEGRSPLSSFRPMAHNGRSVAPVCVNTYSRTPVPCQN